MAVRIEHLNCGWLYKPPFPPASCHCLMIHDESRVILVDTGIGLYDIKEPNHRIGQESIEAAGFQFIPSLTAVRQLEARGITFHQVTDIVLTHCDSDHVGGLSDFPQAKVHVSIEEKENVDSHHPRYAQNQFSHAPRWQMYQENDCETFGLPSRKLDIGGNIDMRLIPLFGHTNGHCGVAVKGDDSWLLHVGDAYYLREELNGDDHPVGSLAALRADDDSQRRKSLVLLREVAGKYSTTVSLFGYHDVNELPSYVARFEEAD